MHLHTVYQNKITVITKPIFTRMNVRHKFPIWKVLWVMHLGLSNNRICFSRKILYCSLISFKWCWEVGTSGKYLGDQVWTSCINTVQDRECGSELEFSCMSFFWGEDWTRRLAAGDDGVILDFPSPRTVRKENSWVFFVVFLFVCLFCGIVISTGSSRLLVKYSATWDSLPAKVTFCKIPS
jgi:hypothetical protein